MHHDCGKHDGLYWQGRIRFLNDSGGIATARHGRRVLTFEIPRCGVQGPCILIVSRFCILVFPFGRSVFPRKGIAAFGVQHVL